MQHKFTTGSTLLINNSQNSKLNVLRHNISTEQLEIELFKIMNWSREESDNKEPVRSTGLQMAERTMEKENIKELGKAIADGVVDWIEVSPEPYVSGARKYWITVGNDCFYVVAVMQDEQTGAPTGIGFNFLHGATFTVEE